MIYTGLLLPRLINIAWETKVNVGRIGAVTNPLIVNNRPSSVPWMPRLPLRNLCGRGVRFRRVRIKEHKVH